MYENGSIYTCWEKGLTKGSESLFGRCLEISRFSGRCCKRHRLNIYRAIFHGSVQLPRNEEKHEYVFSSTDGQTDRNDKSSN